MNADDVAARIQAAASAAAPTDILQITCWYPKDDREALEHGPAWWTEEDGTELPVRPVVDVTVTAHAPGGYIARSGDHYDMPVPVARLNPRAAARAVLRAAARYSYNNHAGFDLAAADDDGEEGRPDGNR